MKVLNREILPPDNYYIHFQKTGVHWSQYNREMRSWFDNLDDNGKYCAFLELLIHYEKKVRDEETS